MSKPIRAQILKAILVSFLFIQPVLAGEGRPLVLQEMAWPDVEQYLKTSDMVIIPLGSTEQHGPQLPLGTDYFEALDICKRVSAKTGVLVAPVLMAGYSEYHTGFPGTLTLKTETLTQVIVETAETLIRYGFRRIMLYNFHGGNQTAVTLALHRINMNTPAMAVSLDFEEKIPLKGPKPAGQMNDPHGGVDETANMLAIHPGLVHMERAQKPVLTFSPIVQQLIVLAKDHPELYALAGAVQVAPKETGKAASLREISSNGMWTEADPQTATAALGEQILNRYAETAAGFIESWKLVKPEAGK